MTAEAIVLPSTIEAVTVYRRGAVVQRVTSLAACAPALRLGGLPLCLDDASVVARVVGAHGPVVTDVAIALEVTDLELPDPPEQAALLAAQAAERRALDIVERLERRLRSLAALASPDRPQGKRGEAPPRVSTADRLRLLSFRSQQHERTSAALADAREQARVATAERQATADALQRATSAHRPREHELRKAALLTLLGGEEGAGPWLVELEYQVPGARWTPSYTVRFSPELDRVDLDLRAAVAQHSGEDWTDVALTVSTALPQRWTELPELQALRIGRRQPPPPSTGWRAPPEGADALFADYDRVARRISPPPPPTPTRRPAPPPEPMVVAPSDARRSRPSEHAAAPPPPRPAPAPQAARARSSGPAALVSSSADAAVAGYAMGGAVADPAPQAPEPPRPGALTAPADLLDYGRLRLRGPDSDHKGRLRPASVLQLYRERIVAQQVVIDRQVITLVEQATRQAGLDDLAMPPGHSAPGPIRDFDHAWLAAHRVDLASDGGWHTLSLQQAEAQAARRYVVVPRQAPEVFRFATFENPLAAPLPTGPADVFVGDELLLSTPLRATDRGARVRLGLGVEEGIKMSRNSRFSEKTSGLLGGSLGLRHELALEVVNNLAVPARVEIRERVPVTRPGDDDVTVTDIEADPPWEAWRQPQRPVRGAHRWMLVVEPGARQALSARYTVEISSKKELVGGNRRER